MKVRRKPVIIDAIRWTGENSSAIMSWNRMFADIDTEPSDIIEYTRRTDADAVYNGILILPTEYGDSIVPAGWWIVRNEVSEYHRCEPVIFDLTYETVA